MKVIGVKVIRILVKTFSSIDFVGLYPLFRQTFDLTSGTSVKSIMVQVRKNFGQN